MKQLVVLIEPTQYEWIKQCAKAQKEKVGPVVRSMLEYLRTNNPKELQAKLSRSRIQAEYELISRRADEAIRQKEKLEKELATINA